MRLTRRQAYATLLVAAIVVPYVGYLVRGSMPFIQDPRGMAATGLILGLVAFAVVGRSAFDSRVMSYVGVIVGTVTLGLGIAAVWAENNDLLLAAFIVGIVSLWAIEALFRSDVSAREDAPKPV